MLILLKPANLLANPSGRVIASQFRKKCVVNEVMQTPKLAVVNIGPWVHHVVGDAKRLSDRRRYQET